MYNTNFVLGEQPKSTSRPQTSEIFVFGKLHKYPRHERKAPLQFSVFQRSSLSYPFKSGFSILFIP